MALTKTLSNISLPSKPLRKTLKSEFQALEAYCTQDAIPFFKDLTLPKRITLKSTRQVADFSKQLLDFFVKLAATPGRVEDFLNNYPLLTKYMLRTSDADMVRALKSISKDTRKQQVLPFILHSPAFLGHMVENFALFKFYIQFYQSTGELFDTLNKLKNQQPEVFAKLIKKGLVARLVKDIELNEAEYNTFNGQPINRDEIRTTLCKLNDVFTHKGTVTVILDYIERTKNHALFEQLLKHPAFLKTVEQSKKLSHRVADFQMVQAIEIAKSLGQLNLHLMNLLNPRDFYQYKDRSQRSAATGLAMMAEVIDRLGRYVTLSVLSAGDKEVRNSRIIQWIMIAYLLRKFHAYDMSAYITENLNKSDIMRLIKNSDTGITAIPDHVLKILEELTELYALGSKNHLPYRTELQTLPEDTQYAVISPILNKDLTFTVDSSKGEGPFSSLIKSLHNQSQILVNTQEQDLPPYMRAFLAAVDPVNHPLQDPDQERNYLSNFFGNLARPSGYGLHELWAPSGLASVVGKAPKVTAMTATKAIGKQLEGKDNLDEGFWEYAFKQSQGILPSKKIRVEEDKTNIEAVKKTVQTTFGDKTLFNRVAKALKTKARNFKWPEARANPALKAKRKYFLEIAQNLEYQEALIKREQQLLAKGKPLDQSQIDALLKNSFAIHFFSNDKTHYKDQFIRRYFSNWMSYITLHASFEEQNGRVVAKTHPVLTETNIERYFLTLNLSEKHKNDLRWFLASHRDYRQKLSQQIDAGIKLLPDEVTSNLEGLKLDQEQINVLTLLANSVWAMEEVEFTEGDKKIKRDMPTLYLFKHFQYVFSKLEQPALGASPVARPRVASTVGEPRPVSTITPETPTAETSAIGTLAVKATTLAVPATSIPRMLPPKVMPKPVPARVTAQNSPAATIPTGAEEASAEVRPAVKPKPNMELLALQKQMRQIIKDTQSFIALSLERLQARVGSGYQFVSTENTEARVNEEQKIQEARTLLQSARDNCHHAATLMNATPLFDMSAVESQHGLIQEQLSLAEERLKEARNMGALAKVAKPSRFVRLEPQLSPNSNQQVLQQVINQSINSMELLPLRLLAERLNLQLATSPEMLNVKDLLLVGRNTAPQLTEASRAYLVALLFDYIGLFNLTIKRAISKEAGPQAGYELIKQKLAQPDDALARAWISISSIFNKLAPNTPIHLLLNPNVRERMEMFHRAGQQTDLVVGAVSLYETIYCMASAESRNLPFTAAKLDIPQDDGAILTLNMAGCRTLKDVLINLTERHTIQTPPVADNKAQLQILNEVMRATFAGLMLRNHNHNPTFMHPNVIHPPEPMNRRQLLRVLMDWHVLYQRNNQLPVEQRAHMQAYTDLFIPAMRGSLQAPLLTADIVRSALQPELLHALGITPQIRPRPCSMEVPADRKDNASPNPVHA